MLFAKGHGKPVVQDAALQDPASQGHVCISEACGFAPGENQSSVDTDSGRFGYLFPDAACMPDGEEATKALDALGDAMVEMNPAEQDDSNMAPIFTYMGQFIDHDITAGTDREAGISTISEPVITAKKRYEVTNGVRNLRAGSLGLDSMYGDGPIQGELSKKFAKLLRYPKDRSKMWLGTLSDVGDPIDLPKDPAADLLKAGRVLEEGISGFSQNDILNLPEPFRSFFVDESNNLINQKAIIGDARNDENLFVAQLHLAWLRFHNRVVDSAHKHGGPVKDKDALFAWAREKVVWHYQWLVLNEYLPAICDQKVVKWVLGNQAPLYTDFYRNNPPGRDELMPLPLEFSVSAFRFGHSMVRASYDWNRNFGRPDNDPDSVNRAGFQLMFAFTGGGGMFGQPKLPSNWPADWKRLSGNSLADFVDRAARKIDSHVAMPLADMANENAAPTDLFKQLMRRNLRRGLRLNIPSAQECIGAIKAKHGLDIKPLTKKQLESGHTGQAIKDGDFTKDTPLWFYVLKEAEIVGGNNLGELGSLLVADTLVGLTVKDKSSYWNQSGSDNGRWHPQDGVQPAGEVVDSLQAMLRAALLL